MINPYANQPDYAFWRASMAGRAPFDVDPVANVPFVIGATDKVATGGSCFAQHISRRLRDLGFAYLVTEGQPEDADYGVFPARFGNIYTARQLLQLLQRRLRRDRADRHRLAAQGRAAISTHSGRASHQAGSAASTRC